MTSKHILTQLEALQKTMLTTDGKREGSFADLFGAFLDIAEDPALLNESKPTKDKTIKDVIETCAQNLVGNSALSIHGLRILRVDKAGFLHGMFFADSSVGTFFYFEKERQGLLAFDRGEGLTLFNRITLVELPEGAVPVPGPPPGSQRS